MKRVRLIISGYVQGIGFRAWVRKGARQLGVTGWVKNREDEAVEVVAEGNNYALTQLVNLCHTGPPAASVSRVDETKEQYTGEFQEFHIAY